MKKMIHNPNTDKRFNRTNDVKERITVRLTEDEIKGLQKLRRLLLEKTDQFPSLTDVFRYSLGVALEQMGGEAK